MPASAPPPLSLFALAQQALSAQAVRMNAAASNLANAGTTAGSEAAAYHPLRPVFATAFDRATGLATVRVVGVYRTAAAAVKEHDPGNPAADANGNVWAAPVDETAETVELMDSARQYHTMIEALQTAKQLMLETMRMKP